MKIIHTSDFKNNTILAHRGIKCVIRGYAFVKDTKKWLAKKYKDSYAFEDITLEELCNNCTLITDEDKNDPDVLNNLFDVTYEPCLELTVPETIDEKGTVLGGEKFGTYKIRINSALNNKIRKGIQGTYRAIVLIGEKYTENDWHVITENKSYIAMFIYFDGSSPECQGEDENGLTIGENSAYTINLQFSLSQLKDIPAGETVKLDTDYAKIMSESKQKDQTTIKLALPGIFLVPSGKEYKNRVEIEDGVKEEHEGIAYMDKTFNLIPNTYKNNNIFNVTPRVNIFDEHDDKFVKPQMLLSYGKKQEDGTFDAQSIGFEYDPRYFKMNEKAPSAATRFDLFGGATKRETSTYDDTRYDPMSGYLRLLCDRGYNIGGQDNLFIKANDVYTDMSHGSMVIADDNRVVENTQTTYIIDSRGTRASGLSAGHIIDSEKIYAQGMDGLTAFASQQASATTDLPGYDKTKDDPYMCPDCEGTGKIHNKVTKYIPVVDQFIGGAAYPSHLYHALVTDGDELVAIFLVENDTAVIPEKISALTTNPDNFFDSRADADLAVAKWIEDHPQISMEKWDPYETFDKTYVIYKKYVVGFVGTGFAIHWAVHKTDDEYTVIEIGAGGSDIEASLLTSERITIDLAYDTEAEAQAFVAELKANWPAELPELSMGPAYVSREFLSEDEGTPETCPRCGGDGRYGNFSMPGRLAMMGLNVSSMEFNGYNNFFIGHKGLMSNFGHDAIIFGNHNACGNKEYNMCQTCLGTGLVECTACKNGTDHPTGKVSAHPNVTCSSCYGFGYVNYSAEMCTWCSGVGERDGQICPVCRGLNLHSGVNPEDWEGFYTCSGYTATDDAIYQCQLCSGAKTIVDESQIVEVLCPECSGYGQMKDPVCSGMGFIQDNEHQLQSSACPTCSETMMTCPACSGQGYSGDETSGTRCEFCGGDKRVCVVCSGTGEHECDVCHGNNVIPCPECNQEDYHLCPICSGFGEFDDGYTLGNLTTTDDRTQYQIKENALALIGREIYNYSGYAANILGTSVKDNTKKRYKCPYCGDLRAYRNEVYQWSDRGGMGYNRLTLMAYPMIWANYYENSIVKDDNKHYIKDVRPGYHVCEFCSGAGYAERQKVIDFLRPIDEDIANFFDETVGHGPDFMYDAPGPRAMLAGTSATSQMDGDIANYTHIACPVCFNWEGFGDKWYPGWRDVSYTKARIIQAMVTKNASASYTRLHDSIAWPSGNNAVNLYHQHNDGISDYCNACNFNGGQIEIRPLVSRQNVDIHETHELIRCRNCGGHGFTIDPDTRKITECAVCNNENKTLCTLEPSEIAGTDWQGYVNCGTCDEGVVPCEACNGARHWLCPTCNGRGEVDFRPIVAYEDGKVIAVGDGYFYKNLMPNQDDFNMYRDYVNIKPENNCDLDVGQYLKRMNLFSVENHGLLTVHNNNYDEVPDSNVVHQVAADFFAVRSWAKYDSLQERFANLQNGCYAPDAIYFTKRTAHNEEWKLRIRELDYLIHDSYIKTNASWLKTAALNQAISEFYKKNNTFTLRLGPIITYAWKGVKGSKGAKGTKGWKGRKGIKGVTLGLKGKKGMKGMKGLKGTKGYKGMTLQIVNKRYKYYIEDILAAVSTEFGKYISNNGNLGKNPETYTFYCINGDPTENLYFKGVRLRKMANGNYQTLNAVKGIKPAEVQRIVYKDNGYYGEYGVMNFNYAYSNKFLT